MNAVLSYNLAQSLFPFLARVSRFDLILTIF